jgi:hypothetical protein
MVRPEQLFFGKSPERPVIEFQSFKTRDLPKNKRPVELLPSLNRSLGPALQTVAFMLPAATFRTGKYMRVVVNGPLAAASDGATYLPFVRGADGKVTELARLVDPRQLAQVTNAIMFWQVASVIVAQKHLADISKQLTEIKEIVVAIAEFLENKRKSTITGNLKYLDHAARAIMQGEFPEPIRIQLEGLEREMLQVQDHLMEDLQNSTERIARIEHSDWVGTAEFTQNIEKHQKHMYELQQEWLLCVHVRAANWQVCSAFPGEERTKVGRKERILESIDEFTLIFDRANEIMQKKIGEVDAFFNRAKTLNKRQADLERQHRQYKDAIASSTTRTKAQVLEVGNRLSLAQKPIVLALKVEQGKVLEAYELNEN